MEIDFTKSPNGLIPAIIQDSKTLKVLMLAYLNAEALEKTQKEKRVTFFSRSKNRLWTKGETSGNFLHVVDIKSDCDNDTLLIKVNPEGPVCHTGSDTCFKEENTLPENFLYYLEQIINTRKSNPHDSSYTSELFEKGINKIAQKVGEEAVELIIEAKDDNSIRFKNEAADLLYHYMVLLSAKQCSFQDIIKVLKSRHQYPLK